MHQSHVIEVSGLFAGAAIAISHGGRFSFLAVHPRVEKPDHNLWHLPRDMLRAVSGMIRTGGPASHLAIPDAAALPDTGN